MKYQAHTSPRNLTTVDNPLYGYPAVWELFKWYNCLRKVPYESDIIAAILAEERDSEYSHYPCPVDPLHWHIGRGNNQADPRKRLQRAKRIYRKAVRDEIWSEWEERQRVVQQTKE